MTSHSHIGGGMDTVKRSAITLLFLLFIPWHTESLRSFAHPWKKRKKKSLFEPPYSVHTLHLAACMRSGSVTLYCHTVRWKTNTKNQTKTSQVFFSWSFYPGWRFSRFQPVAATDCSQVVHREGSPSNCMAKWCTGLCDTAGRAGGLFAALIQDSASA